MEHAKGPQGLASIVDELRYAVADVRQKVVEEGMYGRATTPNPEVGGIHGGGIHGGPEAAKEDGKPEPGRASVTTSFYDRCQQTFEQHRDEPQQEPPAPDRS